MSTDPSLQTSVTSHKLCTPAGLSSATTTCYAAKYVHVVYFISLKAVL